LLHSTAILVSNRKDVTLPLGKQQVNRVESAEVIADSGRMTGKPEVIEPYFSVSCLPTSR
jgi:hypothetical protein